MPLIPRNKLFGSSIKISQGIYGLFALPCRQVHNIVAYLTINKTKVAGFAVRACIGMQLIKNHIHSKITTENGNVCYS